MAQNAARVRAYQSYDDASYAPREIAYPPRTQAVEAPMSAVPPQPAPPSVPSIAAVLQSRRQQLGYSLEDAATALRLRSGYLVALEAGRFDELPGGAYSMGFLRSYAELLGLDGDAAVRLFKEEAVGRIARPAVKLAPVKPAAPAKPQSARRFPAATVLLGALVLGAIGYGAWYIGTTQDRALSALVGPAPSWSPPGTGAAGSTPPAPPIGAEAPAVGAAAIPPEAAEPDPLPPLTAPPPIVRNGVGGGTPVVVGDPLTDPGLMQKLTSDPDALAALGQSARQRIEASVAAHAQTADEAAASAAAEDIQSGLGQPENALVITAQGGESWLQITAPDGNKFSGILKDGTSWSGHSVDGLKLQSGNAGVLSMTLDGKPLPAIGGRGALVKNLPMDPTSLHARLAQ